MSLRLAAQQSRLGQAIVGEGSAVGLLRSAAAGRGDGLQVYRHAYRARLAEALRSNFPVLHRVLGDTAFAELAQAYLRARPSVRPSIRWFGDGLVEHMRSVPGALAHPSLADLARMEWSLGLSFDSADDAVLVPSDLMAVPAEAWPPLRFRGHASVALLRLAWAVEPLWQALTDDGDAEADPPQASPHALLVWRQGLATRWRSAPEGEAALLRACLDGEPFAQLCEQAVAFAGDDAAAFAAGLLRRWIEDGLLSCLRPLERGQ